MTSKDTHTDDLGKIVVNDPAESSFGATTRQLQCFGQIGLGNAGGVSQVQLNCDMKRVLPKIKKGKKATQPDGGLFHMLSNEMRTALLLVARKDAEKCANLTHKLLINKGMKKKERKK